MLNYINAQKENGKEVNLGTNEGVYIANVDEDGNGAEAGLKVGDAHLVARALAIQDFLQLSHLGHLLAVNLGNHVTFRCV